MSKSASECEGEGVTIRDATHLTRYDKYDGVLFGGSSYLEAATEYA